MIYHTGDKPGKGTYTCTTCGQKIVLNSDEEALPICPKCGKEDYTKDAE